MTSTDFDIASFLAEVPLFEGVSRPDLQALASASRLHQHPDGEVIFSEGSPGDELFIIVKGRVRIQARAQDGENVNLTTLGPKQFFGEMALFDQESRSATARVTRMTTELLSLGREEFTRVVRAHPDIGLRMLASQSRRLRGLNERLVRVDQTARQNAPTFSEIVTQQYPHPIALVYQEMDTASDYGTKLRRSLELFEVCLTYLTGLATNCYLAAGHYDVEVDKKLLASTVPTLGNRRWLLTMLVDHMMKRPYPNQIVADLCAGFKPAANHKLVTSLSDDLIALRNSLKHGSEASLDEIGCERLYTQNLPKVTQLLEALDFLQEYPLIYIQNMGFVKGSFHYTYLSCMGAFRRFHTHKFTHPKPLETQKLYLLDASRGEAVGLSPWLGLYRCPVCEDQDVFLTTAWSYQKFQCLEFGRGHGCGPQEAADEAAALRRALEARVPKVD